MKSIDIRFDGATIQILQSLIGQQLDEIKHDPYIQVPSVYTASVQ